MNLIFSDMKQKALQIFLAGVDNVLPNKLVNKVFSRKDFQLDKFNNIYLLAFGKASFLMAKEAENILGERIVDGVVITTYGNGGKLDKLKVIEAGHPIPDNNGLKATKLVLNIADKAQENDLVLCLISGGSSALLADYPTDATINDLKKASELLINSGASISEINCVRKHLSSVKGGQLAKAIYPASTISLILSDVVGDKLDVIASGITAPDCTTFSDAIQVLKKYNLIETFPSVFLNHLRKGMAGIIDETAKPDDIVFNKVENLIIGSNKIALDGAAEKAKELGFETYLITDRLKGDYKYVADFIFKTINSKKPKDIVIKSDNKKPRCLLFGGESTVYVSGNGRGGRNQHLALYLAIKINGAENVTILCAGTDGLDGQTDAAGAVIDGFTVSHSIKNNLQPDDYLLNFDSYNFFDKLGDSVKIGNSGTNVMDLTVVLINE